MKFSQDNSEKNLSFINRQYVKERKKKSKTTSPVIGS